MSIDEDIANLVLRGRSSRLPIGERIESWAYEGGMSAAPSYTLTVLDDDDRLRESLVLDRQGDDVLDRGVTCRIDGLLWELVSIRPAGVTVDLIVEQYIVQRVRRRTKPRKFAPGSFTRAGVLRVLLREEPEVRFVCPARGEKAAASREAAARATPKPTTSRPNATPRASAGGAQGLAAGAKLTVKGAGATAAQRKVGEEILTECARLDAGVKATKATILTGIVESQLANLAGGDRDSRGAFQIRDGTARGMGISNRDTAQGARVFLTRGFYSIYSGGGAIPAGRNGAIKIARDKPTFTSGQVAQSCQGSAFPDAYDRWSKEGDAWLEAFGVATGSGSTAAPRAKADTARETKDGEGYRRGGDDGAIESTWDVGARFADEIRWSWFATLDTELVFADERDLLSAKAAATLRPRRGSVDVIDGARDTGHRVDKLTITVRDLLPRQIPHGSPVIVEDTAGSDGRYLVETVRVGSADEGGTLELRRARDPKREQVTAAPGSSGSGSRPRAGGRSRSGASGDVRDRIVAEAKKTLSSKTGYHYYLAGGLIAKGADADPTPPQRAPNRSDCSQWVRALYLKCGAPDPGIATGAMLQRGRPTSDPKPGDLLVGINHVELFVGNGRTIGHGGKPIHYGNVAYHRANGLTFRTYVKDD